MITPELIAYISQQTKEGKTKDQIKLSLIQGGGWMSSDIDEAFAHLEHPTLVKPPRKHSSALTFFAVVILIVGALYFVTQRFNIHSVQDLMNLLKTITGH